MTVPVEFESVGQGSTSEMLVRHSMFAGPLEGLIESRSVLMETKPWRLHMGIPYRQAMFDCSVDTALTVGATQEDIGFADPRAVSTGAAYRWLAEDFSDVVWTPSPVTRSAAPRAVYIRSWGQVAATHTFETAKSAETWWTLYHAELDESATPGWVVNGTYKPTKIADYSYWRINEYKDASAVLINGDSGLVLQWNPSAPPGQMSLLMVIVPDDPRGDEYTLIRASTDISLVLRSDSTIVVRTKDTDAATIGLSGRSRPNQPMVVCLSLLFGNTPKVLVSVTDSLLKTMTVDVTGPLTMSGTQWFINSSLDAVFEIIEIDLYTNFIDESAMSRIGTIFNQIYGVTAP